MIRTPIGRRPFPGIAKLRWDDEVNMSDEDITTKPTIETVLERINALADGQNDLRDVVNSLSESQRDLQEFINSLAQSHQDFPRDDEKILERIETKLVRVQSMALSLRADMRELCLQLKGPMPEIK